jgi:pyruvate-formate lyase-activating enzyme
MVRFAIEAETATIYTADALRGELKRLSARSRYHSVAIVGGDALAEHEFLEKTFNPAGSLPLMIDHDGQRPEALYGLMDVLALMQVTMDGAEGAPAVERVCASIDIAARKKVAHAVAIIPDASLGDAPLLRIVEQVHEASEASQVVVHPVVDRSPEQDRRWVHWLERAMAVHGDVRILPRWPLNARVPNDQETRNAHSG